MFIYEKKNEEQLRKLFGTMKSLPSVDDKQLIYKDNEGNDVDVSKYIIFYNKEGGIYAGKKAYPTDEDIKLLVYIYGEEKPIWGEVTEEEVEEGQE